MADTEKSFLLKDYILPWCAFAVSMTSLSFSIYLGLAGREHNRLSLEPHLAVMPFGHSSLPIGIRVENNGAGPAVILSVEIWKDGKKLGSIRELKREILSNVPLAKNDIFYTAINVDDFYRAGQQIDIINSREKIDKDLIEDLWNQINRVDIRIAYSSVYRDRRFFACSMVESDLCSIREPGSSFDAPDR